MGLNHDGIVSITLISLATPIALLGSLALVIFRNNIHVRNRGLKNILCSILFGLVIILIVGLADLSADFVKVSCHLVMWPSALFLPAFGYPFFFRAYLLYFNFKWRTDASTQGRGFFASKWFRFFKRSDETFTLYLYAGLIFFTILLTGIGYKMSVDPTTFFIYQADCLPRFHKIFMALQGITFVVMLPVCFWKLYPVRDAFGFKWELLITTIVGLPLVVVWLIARFEVNWDTTFPHEVWPLLVYLCVVLVSVGVPFFYVIFYRRYTRKRRESSTFVAMEALPSVNSNADFLLLVLDTEPLLDSLQKFMVTNWSIENLLFLMAVKAYQEFKGTPEELLNEAQRIYELHLDPRAMFEVNLDSQDTEVVMEALQTGVVTPTLFEGARVKIFNIVKHDSLPRWRLTDNFNEAWGKYVLEKMERE